MHDRPSIIGSLVKDFFMLAFACGMLQVAIHTLIARLATSPQSESTPSSESTSPSGADVAGWHLDGDHVVLLAVVLFAISMVALLVKTLIDPKTSPWASATYAVNHVQLEALASVLGSTVLADGILTVTAMTDGRYSRHLARLDRRALRHRPELATEAWALMWASAMCDTVRHTILDDAAHAKRAARVDVDAVPRYLTDALERRHIDRDVTVTLEPRTTRRGDTSARAGLAYLAATFATARALMLDTTLDTGHRTLAVTVPAGSDFPTVARFVALIDRATRNGLIRQAGSDYDTLRATIDPTTVTDLPEPPDGAAVLDALGERVEAGWTITGEEAETLGAPIPAPKRTPEPLTWFTPTYETRAARAAAR